MDPSVDVAGLAVTYTLGSDPDERERLKRQSDELRPYARAVLGQVDLLPGHHALDLACGPCGVLDLLADRVGPNGQVVGLDASAAHVALASDFVEERGLSNVVVVEGDARRSGLAPDSFDLVHARLLLVNIPEPQEVVAEMVRVARPGGWVASQEADVIDFCHPGHEAMERLSDLLHAVFLGDGADPHIGRRLPELFREAGLVEIGVEARCDLYPVHSLRRMVLADLVRSLRVKVLERGLAGEAELDRLDRAARAHLSHPHTVVMSYVLFQAWGRKP
jgi:ubiquinone/menaquinone biosynthesis C-methylase UbiE